MKVLGKAGSDLIVQIGLHEIAQICGKRFSDRELESTLSLGATVDVSAMFNRLKDLEAMPLQIAKAAESLRTAADILEKPLHIITPPPFEP